MKKYRLDEMTNGWFVGDFEPSIIKTKSCEVAIKTYKKGHLEKKHFHKESYEITCIIKGVARINSEKYHAGDLILIDPYEKAEFEALENVITVVFKSKSIKGDKYLDENQSKKASE